MLTGPREDKKSQQFCELLMPFTTADFLNSMLSGLDSSKKKKTKFGVEDCSCLGLIFVL